MRSLFCKACLIILWIIVLFTNPSSAQDLKIEAETLYQVINDSAINNVHYPETLEKYLYKSDSVQKGNNLSVSWKYKIAQAWLLLSHQKYDSVVYIIDKGVSLQEPDSLPGERELKLLHLATLYRILMKYTEARDYYEMLKEVALENNNPDMIYEAYWGMHSIAKSAQDFGLAKDYLDELLNLTSNDLSLNRFKTYQHYAHNSVRLGEYTTALDYLKLCVTIIDKDPDIIPQSIQQFAWIYNHMGQVSNILGEKADCESCYLKSIEYSTSINNLTLTSDSYANLGIFYLDQKEYDKSVSTLQKSLEFLQLENNDRLKSTVYKFLSAAYDSLDDYKNAYGCMKLYAQISDSLSHSEYRDIYVQERTRFNTEQKEKELEILSANTQTNNIIFLAIISLSGLLIVIIFLLYRQSKLKSKHKLTELEKQIAEAKQEYLRKQMNPHFLFNTLNSIQYFMFNNDKIATNDYMSKFAMLIRKTLENSEKNFNSIKDEIDTLTLYIELEQLRFKNKFSFHLNIDPEIDIIQQKIPTMIIHPFVENAINHGLHLLEHGGQLKVEMEHADNQTIICTVEDNGIGRARAEKIKSTKHQSMGTSITRERLQILNNNLKVSFTDLRNDAGEATGTKVTIIIPVI
jgi:tetratricopeptide (TPR) repeat protein